ncbi:MAG: hypothetical protein NC489_30775 [Ruminococcus flavefaciens]|nr:hypothetical protein [Ruminococcus flavefaciens]
MSVRPMPADANGQAGSADERFRAFLVFQEKCLSAEHPPKGRCAILIPEAEKKQGGRTGMTETENLYVVAMEECAELQQALSKAMRFGPQGHSPDAPERTNARDILDEYCQLMGTMEMLIDSGEVGHLAEGEAEAIKWRKRCRVSDYAQLSKSLGAIDGLPTEYKSVSDKKAEGGTGTW